MENKTKIILISISALVVLLLVTLLLLFTGKSSLEVTTEPKDATVYIDEKEEGKTPLTMRDVQPGNHTLKIRKEGYEEVKKDLNIKKGKNTVNQKLGRALPPITKKLPQNTDKYIIAFSPVDANNSSDIVYKITLKAILNKVTPERWARYQNQLKENKKSALDWLKENGVDVEKAQIEYTPKEAKDL